MISVIELVLSLLSTVLDSAQVKGLPQEVIAGVQAAIAALEKVRGTPVTLGQLEDLRVTPKW